jgi:hypothetical protein
MSFFTELRRRNVYRAAVFYAAAGWLLVQIATQVFPVFNLPNWTMRLVVVMVVVGFPLAMVLAWFYEITPQGLKRESEVEHGRIPRALPRAAACEEFSTANRRPVTKSARRRWRKRCS